MKKIVFAIAAICCLALASCTKTTEKITYAVKALNCTYDDPTEWADLANDLSIVMSDVTSQNITDDATVIAKCDQVIPKYDKKSIQGTLILTKNDSNLKTYTLTKGTD